VSSDLLDRRSTHFVLWRPKIVSPAPALIIGRFEPGNPPRLGAEQRFSLSPDPAFPDLFQIAAADCQLADEQVFHYWFEVTDTNPLRQAQRVRCTDPFAWAVDWRLLAEDREPAATIKFSQGRLVPSDPGGEQADFTGDPSLASLPLNNQLVIYELPTAWSRISDPDDLGIGAGTFRDVVALIDPSAPGANFDDLDVLAPGRSYLTELGVNALELLPAADSFFKREWGYDTSHYLAPDSELGFPEGFSSSTANLDLASLVRSCHQHGVRFFIDVVMAFARNEAYQTINFDEFYIANPASEPDDPDAHQSRPGGGFRDGFGSTLFRYARFVDGYDPLSGQQTRMAPARQLMLTSITRWMRDFRVDGVRMDSVENVANWDFVGQYTNLTRSIFSQRWADQGLGPGADSHILVVGEELSLPMALLTQGRLDGLWNDAFRSLVRSAILGQGDDFESTIRSLVDCRAIGFTDGTQAVNYITSHDVEGFARERLYNYLLNNHIADADIPKRIKLAFVCLLTAVGIPMILAGEEFADEHDRFDRQGDVTQAGGKQVDPVNFSRLSDPWRTDIFDYVSRLVKLRTAHPALGVNDTDFIHVDFNDGKRVLAWKRGLPGADPVIVVANFSDFATVNALSPGGEYVVQNWPATPAGRHWREVSQARDVPDVLVGREPIFSWEAKVYTLA
jgi:pullulanase